MTLLKRGEGFEKSLAAIAMLSIVALAAILVFLLTQALPILKDVPFFTFLFGTEWYPTGPNPDFEIGDLMIITDQINALPENPLHGKNFPTGPRFLDMHEAYNASLIAQADQIAAEKGIKVQHGVYLATQGPTYETPAEYKMFRIWGADAVGMSTVPEVIVANHCGIKCFGISVITDLGVEGKIVEVSHEDVQKAADAVQPLMAEIMREMINRA